MITVVIPTINRPSLIDCLRSIYEQINPPEFEVIVVTNNYSKYELDIVDETFDWMSSIKVIEYTGYGNGPAKNHAVMFAKGDFIVFTDDDCIVDKDWLSRLYITQQKTNADIVVGQVVPADLTNPYLVAHQGIIMKALDDNPYVFDGKVALAKAEVGTSMNMLIRKSAFECLGGFSKEFAKHYGDDFEFNMRWKADDTIKAVYCKSAIVKHNHLLTFWKLMKLSFRMGIGMNVCEKLFINKYTICSHELDRRWCLKCKAVHMYPGWDHKNLDLHTPYSEYKYIRDYIFSSNFLFNCSAPVAEYASWLACLAMLVKRFGSWYGSKNHEAISKVYDGV